MFLCGAVRAHLPGEHQRGKAAFVGPWERIAFDIYLILDDGASCFYRTRISEARERVDQGTFSGTRPPSENEKSICFADQLLSSFEQQNSFLIDWGAPVKRRCCARRDTCFTSLYTGYFRAIL